jgi:MFS family permease
LLATYAVGFGVLFCFISIFTYINFRLAAPPYNLSATWLGAIFFVYLLGAGLAPMAGWAVSRFGRRHFMIPVIGLWSVGVLLTLSEPLWLIIAGLTMSAASGLMCQTISTGYVTITAKAGRSSAVGLYVTSFYVGGSFGAALGGIAWTFGGWPACVAMIVTIQIGMGAVVYFLWTPGVPQTMAGTTVEPP